jgi:hypothetical protein
MTTKNSKSNISNISNNSDAERFKIGRASVGDVDELLRLYYLIYHDSYPLPICSNRKAMTTALEDANTYWYVTREVSGNAIIASTIFETDPAYLIGKLTGVVVHPLFRRLDLASKMIAKGTADLLIPNGNIRSIYTTTRTTSRGPQAMCLTNGFLPLGIFPNAHKLFEFETLTLLAKFGDGVLEARKTFAPVPERIAPLIEIFQESVCLSDPVAIVPAETPSTVHSPEQESYEFEVIRAPEYVLRRFNEIYTDPYDRFFPFHKPNLLVSSTCGDLEIFGYLNKADGYLAIVALNKPLFELGHRMRPLLNQLRDIGVSYIELLMGLQFTASLNALMDAKFLPSAIYPAMYERDGKINDFVVMTRTLEPLNFSGMQIEAGFKPYVDLYVKLWKSMYLETLEVFDDFPS